MLAAAHLSTKEPGGLEDADMAGHRREGDGQRFGQVGDAGVAGPQSAEERSPGGIGQRRIGAIQRPIFNHPLERSTGPTSAEPCREWAGAASSRPLCRVVLPDRRLYGVPISVTPLIAAVVTGVVAQSCPEAGWNVSGALAVSPAHSAEVV